MPKPLAGGPGGFEPRICTSTYLVTRGKFFDDKPCVISKDKSSSRAFWITVAVLLLLGSGVLCCCMYHKRGERTKAGRDTAYFRDDAVQQQYGINAFGEQSIAADPNGGIAVRTGSLYSAGNTGGADHAYLT